MNRTIARWLLGLITLIILAACNVTPGPTSSTGATTGTPPAVTPVAESSADPQITEMPTGNGQAPIVIVRAEGGLCQAGAGGCWSQKQIMADGSYLATDGTGLQKNGTLPAAEVTKLAELIAAADFAQIGSQPFTGTCPLAFDGQEVAYTFPAADGAPSFASCKVGIDENDPLFQQIGSLVDLINQEAAR